MVLSDDQKPDDRSDEADENWAAKRGKRASVDIAAEFVCGAVRGRARIRDLSLTGLLLEELSEPLEKDAKLIVSLRFFPTSLPVHIPCQVMRQTEAGAGVRFVSVPELVKAALRLALAGLVEIPTAPISNRPKDLFRKRPG